MPARVTGPLADTWPEATEVGPESTGAKVELLSRVRLPVFSGPPPSLGMMVPPLLFTSPTVPLPPSVVPASTCTAPTEPLTSKVVPAP